MVERAGEAFVTGKDPYSLIKPHQHITVPAGQPAYDVYNPYLPLMSLFGGPRSTHASPRLTDARVAFSVFTILIVVVAMALCRGPTGPRVLALAEHDGVAHRRPAPRHRGRRRPGGGAAVARPGAAPTAKTAVGGRRPRGGRVDEDHRLAARRCSRSWWRGTRTGTGDAGRRWPCVAGIVGVMIPAVLPTATENMSAFIENVVRFPLGLAGVQSPAASPLIGHLVVSLFPGIHRVFTVAVAGVGPRWCSATSSSSGGPTTPGGAVAAWWGGS